MPWLSGICEGGPLHRKRLIHPEPTFIQWSADGKRWNAWTGTTPPDVAGAVLAAYVLQAGRWRWVTESIPSAP